MPAIPVNALVLSCSARWPFLDPCARTCYSFLVPVSLTGCGGVQRPKWPLGWRLG